MNHDEVTVRIRSIETLSCDAGWRNYHFVKLTTEDGVVGWSEFDEDFGPRGLTNVIELYAPLFVGADIFNHERTYMQVAATARPARSHSPVRITPSLRTPTSASSWSPTPAPRSTSAVERW